jgi:putative flippase GtrA
MLATATSMIVLGALVATGAMAAGWANVVATGVGTVPSFELNRRWVWGRQGRRRVLAEIGPFCALSFAGLALSTLAVSLAARWATTSGLGAGGRTLASEGASVATFGTLWIGQYVLLDRVLFARRAPTVTLVATPPTEAMVEPSPDSPAPARAA